jgi:hypothetical protein
MSPTHPHASGSNNSHFTYTFVYTRHVSLTLFYYYDPPLPRGGNSAGPT